MANFTNTATLSYNNNTVVSNTVTGEIQEVLSVTKTPLRNVYTQNDTVTYVITVSNSGTLPFTDLTLSDNLGAYTFGDTVVTPLTYIADSLKYYVGGALQTTPTVTSTAPLTVSGILVPAGGTAFLIYEAATNAYTPLAAESQVENTVTINGTGLAAPITATAVISALSEPILSISKALCPTVVTENGTLTYTFTVQNFGNTAADDSAGIVITDTFDPILRDIRVTNNQTSLVQTTDYTYDTVSGNFATVAGKITVPAATYTQNADGSYTITPGVSVLTVTGTV